MIYNFDVEQITKRAIERTRDWFEENGKGCNAVIGISGGVDSSVTAALCVEALGRDRVIGVLMPNGRQSDINMSVKLCKYLKIRSTEVNIKDAYDALFNNITDMYIPDRDGYEPIKISKQTIINCPPRLRMATLYAISQSNNGRVMNTCNLSEDWIGYSTRYGDAAGDFSPLAGLTKTEVRMIGVYLGLPMDLVNKIPTDGLCGKTDEENFGFSYDVLDNYIRTGVCEDKVIKLKIDEMHKKNLFKLQLMPTFDPGLPIAA